MVVCDNGEQIDQEMAVAAACELPIELYFAGLFDLDEVFRLTKSKNFLSYTIRGHDVVRTLSQANSHTSS